MRRYKTPEQLKQWRNDWEVVHAGFQTEDDGAWKSVRVPRWRSKNVGDLLLLQNRLNMEIAHMEARSRLLGFSA